MIWHDLFKEGLAPLDERGPHSTWRQRTVVRQWKRLPCRPRGPTQEHKVNPEGHGNRLRSTAQLDSPLAEWDPKYSHQEEAWFKTEGGSRLHNGWWKLRDGRIVIPETLAPTFVKQFHQRTHFGRNALESTLTRYFYVPRLSSISQIVCEQCLVCARNNPRQGPVLPPGVQHTGGAPFEDLTIDFTEMPRSRGLRYLLVFVCTYSGWVEAFPTRTEKAREVARLLLQEIIPRFGLPLSIGSDNGPAFVAEVIQLLAKLLCITWKLHTAYRPQSSGQSALVRKVPDSHNVCYAVLTVTFSKIHTPASSLPFLVNPGALGGLVYRAAVCSSRETWCPELQHLTPEAPPAVSVRLVLLLDLHSGEAPGCLAAVSPGNLFRKTDQKDRRKLRQPQNPAAI
ncbi:uncharacterized protein RBU33_003761 [Hipposideros larvatus]